MMFNSKSYLQDLESQIKRLDLEKLKDKKILISGSTGLICSYIIDMLIYANLKKNTNITIMAISRSEESLKNRFSYYFDNELFIPVIQNVCEPLNCHQVDYIIHGASNANPKLYIEDPIGTMNANYLGTLNMLEVAKRCNAKMLFISSGDVYGQFETHDDETTEDQYGYIDILNVRSSYASSKRAAETLCVGYHSQYGVSISIVRPAHIYGPTYTKSDTRAVSDFINKATNGEDIIMKSDGAQIRSYCYCLDCASAMLKVLIKGQNCHAYNISNPDSIITVKEMAEILSNCAGVSLKMELPTDEERKGFNPMSNSSLESNSLIELGWKGCFDANTGFSHTVKILKKFR